MVGGGGEIMAATERQAIFQAYLHECMQPISSLSWDAEGASIEAEAEGCYLPLMLEHDIGANTPRDILRELKRVAAKTRYNKAITNITLESLVISGDSCIIGVAVSVDGEALSGSLEIGG